jgi:molybdopterin-guanine dinucleotide biosynthesis protein
LSLLRLVLDERYFAFLDYREQDLKTYCAEYSKPFNKVVLIEGAKLERVPTHNPKAEERKAWPHRDISILGVRL